MTKHVALMHYRKALEHFNARRWTEARDALSMAETSSTGIPSVYVLRSYVESYLGHYRSADDAALAAAGFIPDNMETASDVIARLRTFNHGNRLLEYINRIGGPPSLAIPVLLQAAAQLSYLNLQEESLSILQEAEKADPNYPPTQLSKAQVLVYMGRREEAISLLRRAQRRTPEISDIYWLLAQLGPGLPGSLEDVDFVYRQLDKAYLQIKDKIQYGFAMHRMLAEQGRIGESFVQLEAACKAKRSILQTDKKAQVDMFGALKKFPIGSQETTVPGEGDRPTPIFIIGMHRSGTTLLEQMLDGHPSVHGAGELYDFTSAMRYQTDHHCQGVIDQMIIERAAAEDFDFKAVGARYLDGVAWRLQGKPYFTDKLPSNFLNAGFICQALPQAKLLHMVRDPIEVCFSNLRELFSNANPYSYDQIELADFYLQYHRLMAHWRQAYPGRILDIRYDRLVRDPETVIREVCDFSGLEFTPEMLAIGNRKRGVSTASAVQVREGIQVRDVPKWKPYEAYLQPMINRLREGGVLD